MTATLQRVHRPCSECPWRRDTDSGMFPACRYDALRATAGRPGAEAGLHAPMFACHKSPESGERACAGWLATVGGEHLGVRLAVAAGRLDPAALRPGDGWPLLFDTYEEMAATQGLDGKDPVMDVGAEPAHPDVRVRLIGVSGEAFVVIGAVAAALRREVGAEVADGFARAAFACGSYDELLALAHRTVTVT